MSGIVGKNLGRGSGIVTATPVGADAVSGANVADDAIDSEHLADNAVGLAAMAGGTDGQIITYDASGDPVAVGPGTDGQVLTSTGAGSPPAFEAVSTGLALNDAVTTDTKEQTSTSTTYADVLNGSSATLELGPVTPVSSSNRLYLTGYMNATNTAGDATQHRFYIQPMGDIGGAGYANLYTEVFHGQYGCNSGNQDSRRIQFHFIWSPSTTSACKIKFQYKWAYASTSGSVVVKATCNLRLLEIGPA